MRSHINIIDKKILLELFKARSNLSSFTLFQRSKVPFPDFMRSLQKLKKDELLDLEENVVVLSKKGIKLTLIISKNIDNKSWRQIPEVFVGIKIDKNGFYVPNIELLDIDFTNKTL